MTPPGQLLEEPGQRDEVLDAEAGPTRRQHQERIGPLDVGPARRQRTDAIGSGLPEEDPVLAPGVGVADELELPAAQGVERVGHPKSLRIAGTSCS